MSLKDLERSDHRLAIAMAWLDLCHAHGKLADWEPDIAILIRAAITKMLEKYPDVQSVLKPPKPDWN